MITFLWIAKYRRIGGIANFTGRFAPFVDLSIFLSQLSETLTTEDAREFHIFIVYIFTLKH